MMQTFPTRREGQIAKRIISAAIDNGDHEIAIAASAVANAASAGTSVEYTTFRKVMRFA
jgi:hypothetical protein